MLGKAFWSVWRTFWCWQFLTGWGRWLSPINMILTKVSDCLWQFLFLPEVSVCYGIFSLPPSLSACWYMGSLRFNSFLYGLSFQVKCIEFTLLWTGPLNEVELNWVESKLWVSTSSLCCVSLSLSLSLFPVEISVEGKWTLLSVHSLTIPNTNSSSQHPFLSRTATALLSLLIGEPKLFMHSHWFSIFPQDT